MKKKEYFKKVLSILLMLTLIVALIQFNTAKAQANSVTISKTKLTIALDTKYTLKISGTSNKIKWSSSNKSIATVSSTGKITALREGVATINATVGSKKYTCKLTIKDFLNNYIYKLVLKAGEDKDPVYDDDVNFTVGKSAMYFSLLDYKSTFSLLGYNGDSYNGLMWLECANSDSSKFWGYESASHTGHYVTSCYLDNKENLILNLKDYDTEDEDTYKFTYYKSKNYKEGIWNTTKTAYSEVTGAFSIVGEVEDIYAESGEW